MPYSFLLFKNNKKYFQYRLLISKHNLYDQFWKKWGYKNVFQITIMDPDRSLQAIIM